MKGQIIRLLSCAALLMCCTLYAKADEVGDSIDSYQNHVVSDTVMLQGRTTLNIQNVTVAQTGFLKATSPDGIEITGPFEVQLGGQLELNGGRQWKIHYTYDASGNRKTRKRDY